MLKSASRKGISDQVANMIKIAKEKGEDKSASWALSVIHGGALSQAFKFFIISIMLVLFTKTLFTTEDPAIIKLINNNETIMAWFLVISLIISLAFWVISVWRIMLVNDMQKEI